MRISDFNPDLSDSEHYHHLFKRMLWLAAVISKKCVIDNFMIDYVTNESENELLVNKKKKIITSKNQIIAANNSIL